MLYWRRHSRARGFKFSGQTVHILDVIIRAFAVLALCIVAAATSEIGSPAVVGAGQCPIRNSVAINVAVPGKSTQALQIFLVQHFSARNWLLWIVERICHPVVHPQ